MAVQGLKQFTFNFKEITIDEIALEGLEGIVLDLLWRRIEYRISTNLTPLLKCRLWSCILNNIEISCYKLPEPRLRLELMDRFRLIDENSGNLCDPPEALDGPYEYHPIKDAYGSCEHYDTRTFVPKEDLKKLSLGEVVSQYGDSLVLVASLEERWRALAPHLPLKDIENMSITHYCLLELIGKSRENGQLTVGNSNILKIIKDSKFLFYNRKVLQTMSLITTAPIMQICGPRGVKCILLRLSRFHLPRKVTMIPRCGKMRDIVEYLQNKPNYSASIMELVKRKVIKPDQIKRLKKMNIFLIEEKPDNNDDGDDSVVPVKKKRPNKECIRTSKRHITLAAESDESSNSDDDSSQNVYFKPQSKVVVSLYRQAYEVILQSGLRGLTQVELGKILGIEFYASRNICKTFKSRNIVREILEDKGRQRSTRYIAIAATGQDQNFNEEKQKMFTYLKEISSKPNNSIVSQEPVPSTSNHSDEPAKKRIKLDPEEEIKESDGILEILAPKENVTGYSEVMNSKKGPTLRHLKYANGMLKITREKVTVAGYQTLSHLIAQEIHEPPMDTKAIRNLVQRLFVDGQLKLFKLKWPGHTQKFTNLICSPHMTRNHPAITAKFKEICVRSFANRKTNLKKETKPSSTVEKPFNFMSFPRYMKLQKLHEFVIKLLYFEDVAKVNDLPRGFSSLIHILPEMSVELAIGHISRSAMSHVFSLKLNDKLLKMRLREAPFHVYKLLLQSQSLQHALKANLSILASFGLIQLCHKPSGFDNHSGLLKYIFYVNRHAKLLDTTGSWPREDANEKELERKFTFECLDDVTSYWKALFKISMGTVVVGRKKGRQVIPASPVRTLDVVAQYDNGAVYGDGRGPAGLDSNYFLEVRQSWELLHLIDCKKSTAVPQKNKKIKKEAEKPVKPRKKKIDKKKKVVVKKIEKPKRPRIPEYALKWSKAEDKMLMLIKAAMTIMSPVSQPGCLTVRNLAAKDILSVNDSQKTASYCHRRINTLEANSTLTHERECLINELRRRPHLISKYQGLLKKIRLANPLNLNRYICTARVPTMELIWLLLRLSKSQSYNKIRPCIAVNLEEFNSKYSITTSTVNRPYNLYRYSPTDEYLIGTIKEGIMMALTIKHDTSDVETSEKVYSFIDKCDERTLRTAIDELRKSGAVCVREKNLNNLFIRYSFQDVMKSTSSKYKATMSTYRMSAIYFRRMGCKLSSKFADILAAALTDEFPKDDLAKPELVCALLESQISGDVSLITTTAPNVAGSHSSLMRDSKLNFIDIDAHFKLRVGSVTWNKRKNFKTFAENIPKFDYESILQSLVSDAMVYPADSSVKYPENDTIIILLRERREKGATFIELQELCCSETKTLVSKLEALESQLLIKRVGFNENLLVLTEFAEEWSLHVENHRLIPTPWLSLEGNINVPWFLKWGGVVLNKIFENPAMSIAMLSDECEYLTARAVQELCVFLYKTECIRLRVIIAREPDLFSDEDVELKEYDYFKYASPKSILAYPVKNSFTMFSYIRKLMLTE